MRSAGSRRKALSFPNQSRNFDAKRNRVCFWGYDSAIEISFYLETGALKKINPKVNVNEAEILQAFDAARVRIYEAAQKAYGRDQKNSYAFSLSEADF